MVSDIRQLQKVIHSLEEEASKVSQFNGVLDRIDEAKSEVLSAKAALVVLSQKQEGFASQITSSFEVNSERLGELEKKLVSLERNQKRAIVALSELDVLTPKQFEERISSVKSFVEEQIMQSHARLESESLAQALMLKSLRNLAIVSLSALLLGIALLVKGLYL